MILELEIAKPHGAQLKSVRLEQKKTLREVAEIMGRKHLANLTNFENASGGYKKEQAPIISEETIAYAKALGYTEIVVKL